MKINFALLVSPDGIALAHRQEAGHWALVAEARLDDGDLDAAMGGIRHEAAARGGAKASVLIVLPDDQVLYTSFTAAADDIDLVTQRITDGLDGLTPYAVDDLAYDWQAVDQDRVKVAVVARETLAEAAGFAASHGFESAGFAAMPPTERFPGMPLFAAPRASDDGEARPSADRSRLRDLTVALGLVDGSGMVFGADTYVPPPVEATAPATEADAEAEPEGGADEEVAGASGAKRKGKAKAKTARGADTATGVASRAAQDPASDASDAAGAQHAPDPGPEREAVHQSQAAPQEQNGANPASSAPAQPAADAQPEQASVPAEREPEGELQRALFDRDADDQAPPALGKRTTNMPETRPPGEAAEGAAPAGDLPSAPIVDLFLDQTIAPLAAEDQPRGAASDHDEDDEPPVEQSARLSFATASRGKVAGVTATAARPLTADRPLDGPAPTERALDDGDDLSETGSTVAFAPRRGKVPRPDGGTADPLAARKPRFGLANPGERGAATVEQPVLHPDAETPVPGGTMPGVTKPGSRLAAHLARVRDASKKAAPRDLPAPGREPPDRAREQTAFGVALPGSAASGTGSGSGSQGTPAAAATGAAPFAPVRDRDGALPADAPEAASMAARDGFDDLPGALDKDATPAPATTGGSGGLFRRYIGRGGAQRQTGGAARAQGGAETGTQTGTRVGENAFSRGLLARKSNDPAAPSLRTGLLLTLVLLILLALIAVWSALFLPDSPLAKLFSRGTEAERASASAPAPNAGAPPVAFSTPPAMGTRDAGADEGGGTSSTPDTQVGEETPASPLEAEAAGAMALLAPDAAAGAATEPAPAPGATPQPDAEMAATPDAAALPDIDADFELPPLPPTAEALLPSVEETERIYAEDGIWPRTPERPTLAPLGLATDVYVASLDPEVLAIDAIALGDPAIDPTETLRRVPPPPAFGTMPVRDAQGLIAATPEGVLTPEGAFVVLGRPPVLSVPRPREVVPAVDTAAPAPLDDASVDLMPPRPRPGNLGETRERQVLGGFSERELAGLRPDPRPASVQEIASAASASAAGAAVAGPEAGVEPDAQARLQPGPQASLFPQPRTDQAAAAGPETAAPTEVAGTALAVASSRVPRTRPDNIAVLVAAAVQTPAPAPAASAASSAAAAAVAAAATTTLDVEPAENIDATEQLARAPSIPSSADVSRAATERNAIRLRSVNLIGVTGTQADRRALIRLPSGRFVRVGVGDQLDGGRVAAIGQTSLQYVRNGRNMTLDIPG